MTWAAATLTQLYTVAFHDEMATTLDRQLAAQEIAERMRRLRKPYQNVQHRIRRAYPR